MERSLEQLVFGALGAALLAREKLEQTGGQLQDWQREAQQRGEAFFAQALERGSAERDALKGSLRQLVAELVDELGLATREDLQRLEERLLAARRDA
ncbi:hypothetical protein [Desulfuromonas thiophila]|jgi:hypothetical protein|uniref:Polyhydroxyalkanoate synthesis regulator phasin n=1 Tax=Desulfuromonas thiophila TaxID=57664 RepID=A0A1G6XMH4_9BACT|nr:hypothetical protein [Desulfuromonas thiophila]MCK9173403.1 hypothetical protein [Desulfuromonas thiophila]MDD3802380.1 hypothetical protein [Desulfuromonas thiophila]SDD78456.1 hypothetical protein SAMN05661003_101300 [Desulfuromonas thiophila]